MMGWRDGDGRGQDGLRSRWSGCCVLTLSVRVVVRVRGKVTEESSAEANWRRHTDDVWAVCVWVKGRAAVLSVFSLVRACVWWCIQWC
jgi:hypothetical protein